MPRGPMRPRTAGPCRLAACGGAGRDRRQRQGLAGPSSRAGPSGAHAGAGITTCKVGQVWPLEPEGIAAWAAGLDLVMVVEEKRALIEPQLKEILFDRGLSPRWRQAVGRGRAFPPSAGAGPRPRAGRLARVLAGCRAFRHVISFRAAPRHFRPMGRWPPQRPTGCPISLRGLPA